MIVDKVDVKVTGPGASEAMFTRITGDLPIQTGDRLTHSNYEALKGGLLRAAATNGYLDARMLRNEMRVDPQAHAAQITIEFETGERYRFGATTIKQDSIDDSLIRRFVRYRENDYFDATELLRTQFALDDSQYFSTVEVLPEERDREQHIVPISIVAEPNRRHRYSYGVGYGTDTQVRGTVAWEDRRVNQRGHRFRTEAKAAATAQSIDARYIVPIGDPAIEKFQMQLAGEHERNGDIDDRSVNFIPSFTHVRGPWFGHYWQRVTYVELLHARIRVHRIEPHRHPVAADSGHQFLAGAAQLSRRSAVQPRALRRAARLARRARIGFQLPADSHAGRSACSISRRNGTCWCAATSAPPPSTAPAVSPLRNDSSRAAIAACAVSASTNSHPWRRPPTPTTIRSSTRTTTRSTKRSAANTCSPAHWKSSAMSVRRFAVAVFADAGNAFDSFDDPLMYSAGIGVRLRLPVVSVGLDVAQALTTPAGSTERPGPRLHLNFSPKL